MVRLLDLQKLELQRGELFLVGFFGRGSRVLAKGGQPDAVVPEFYGGPVFAQVAIEPRSPTATQCTRNTAGGTKTLAPSVKRGEADLECKPPPAEAYATRL